jgi:phytoene dehydrogenase-like protein
MLTPVTVVGGGIAGLVAAIEAAERGASVRLVEGRAELGGRARTQPAPYRADVGPHALYPPNPFWTWLSEKDLRPKTVRPQRRGYRVLDRGHIKLVSARYVRTALMLRGPTPVDAEFRAWATEKAGPDVARVASSILIGFTYDFDPGRLSAAFAVERLRRLVSPSLRVRYVVGGWRGLVEVLEQRARSLGVAIEVGIQLYELPEPPVIVATDPRNASILLGDDSLRYSTGRVALLDVATRRARGMPTAVFDLDSPTVAIRHTSVDPTLAPHGEELIQVATGFPPGEPHATAVARMEAFLDKTFRDWRSRKTWERRSSVDFAAGAVDLPGTTWRDRPAIEYADGVYLAGDWVAAPGLLSDVAFNSAVVAAKHAAGRLSARVRQ